MVYFLENKPEFIEGFLERNPDEFLRFIELVNNESSYDDIVINEGRKYISNKNNPKEDIKKVALLLADKLIARPVTSEEQKIEILNLLLKSSEDPHAQRLLKRLYVEFIGLPNWTVLDFDINSDGATLYKLGKMISMKK